MIPIVIVKQKVEETISPSGYFLRRRSTTTPSIISIILASLLWATGCQSIIDRQDDVRPRVLHDVPAVRLAFRLEPDATPPVDVKADESDKLATIQTDFTTRRPDDALLRTVTSPDGQRALALYGTEDAPSSAFQIDMYAVDGKFLRNLSPPSLSCVFPENVSWSPDGNYITFVAHRRVTPNPSPTPLGIAVPDVSPVPSPSVAPAFPAVATFDTEQIYICNRDGYDLKPLTTREGLIYFYCAWAPDNHALVALACKEPEWNAREKESKLPAGRPRLIAPDGNERLLADELTDALPVWSPDSSKVATAFDVDIAIYDAATKSPTQARAPLRDPLIAASVAFEQKSSKPKPDAGNKDNNKASSQPTLPASFNPIVHLQWVSPEKLYLQTAYVRLMRNETINTFQRWHLLVLSAQAAVLR